MSACPLLCGANWEDSVFKPNCCACMFELGQTLDDEGLDEKQPILESLWKAKIEMDEATMKRIEVNYKVMQDKLKATQAELKATQAALEATRAELKTSQANLKARFVLTDIVL